LPNLFSFKVNAKQGEDMKAGSQVKKTGEQRIFQKEWWAKA
jgi:hypothetical protein